MGVFIYEANNDNDNDTQNPVLFYPECCMIVQCTQQKIRLVFSFAKCNDTARGSTNNFICYSFIFVVASSSDFNFENLFTKMLQIKPNPKLLLLGKGLWQMSAY